MPKKFSTTSSTLLILSLVMIINALSYGTIIPLLYPYAARFGINAAGLGLLFAAFSLFQFFATPIMGRLSDRWGRKPLLFLSLIGSAVSLAMFASAQSAAMLFVARALDGITGGNISIAQAIIADTTTGKDRARGMGMLGAAFGFGFLFGPALGGMLSPLGLAAPFWLAAGLAVAGSVLTLLFLPETLTKTQLAKAVYHEPMFNFGKSVKAMRLPGIGELLWLSLITGIAHFGLVIGFQSYSVDILNLTAQQVGFLFTGFGIVNVIMQVGGVALLLKLMNSKLAILKVLLLVTTFISFTFAISTDLWVFASISMLYGISFSPQMVMIIGSISESTNQEDQGVMLGINQSIQSLGQIIGPLLAGLVAGALGVAAIFPVSGVIFMFALIMAWSLRPAKVKADV